MRRFLLGLMLATGLSVFARSEEAAAPQSASPAQESADALELTPEEFRAHLAREEAFDRAVNEYQAKRNVNDWRVRVGIDRRLQRAAGKLPPQYLAARLDALPGNLEVATAAAVCLGEGSQDDSADLVSSLITKLLGNEHERVRYRAAEAVIQRIQDGTFPAGAEQPIGQALATSVAAERNPLNKDSMRYALKLLKERVGTPAEE